MKFSIALALSLLAPSFSFAEGFGRTYGAVVPGDPEYDRLYGPHGVFAAAVRGTSATSSTEAAPANCVTKNGYVTYHNQTMRAEDGRSYLCQNGQWFVGGSDGKWHSLAQSTTATTTAGVQTAASQTLRDRIRSNNFGSHIAKNRGLIAYTGHMGQRFLTDLAKLGPADHWIDGGSGNSLAAEEYVSGNLFFPVENGWQWRRMGLGSLFSQMPLPAVRQRARVTAVSYAGRVPPTYQNRLANPQGRFLEDYKPEELTKNFGKAKLITDVYGAFAYSDHPDRVLQVYLDSLAPGGVIYLSEDHIRTLIDGKTILSDWVQAIPGLQVQRFDNYLGDGNVLRLTVTSGAHPQVPPLQVVNADHDLPPYRWFTRAKTPTAAHVPPTGIEPVIRD